jgi:hypothetical protein
MVPESGSTVRYLLPQIWRIFILFLISVLLLLAWLFRYILVHMLAGVGWVTVRYFYGSILLQSCTVRDSL